MNARIARSGTRIASRAIALSCLAASLALPALASDAPAWAHQLPNELMSPFCPGVTLAECPSPQASSLKMWILVQASAGREQEDIREELYSRYGDQIRPTPKAEGIGIAAYVIPVAVFLAGGGFLAWFLQRWTRPSREGAPGPAAALDPEDERKLDEILGSGDARSDGR